jgi:hypothetical protein
MSCDACKRITTLTGHPCRYCGRLNVEAQLAAEQLRQLRNRTASTGCEHRHSRPAALGDHGRVCTGCGALGRPTGEYVWRKPNTAERAFYGIEPAAPCIACGGKGGVLRDTLARVMGKCDACGGKGGADGP